MMCRSGAVLTALALVLCASVEAAPITSLGSPGLDQWWGETGGTGTVSIGTSPTGRDGLKFTTGNVNSGEYAKAWYAPSGTFGTVVNILANGLALSYDYYKQSGTGAGPAPAPALRLVFQDGANFATLVYEAYWNGGNPVPDQWNTVDIDLNNGQFWSNGGLGTVNSAGGPPLATLQTWLSGAGFNNASLVALNFGVGTWNPNEVGFVDGVSIIAPNFSTAQTGDIDFQAPSAVPEPGSMALLGIGSLGLSFVAARRRKAAKIA